MRGDDLEKGGAASLFCSEDTGRLASSCVPSSRGEHAGRFPERDRIAYILALESHLSLGGLISGSCSTSL